VNIKDSFIEQAKSGSAEARRYALEDAAQALRKGEPMTPAMTAFIANGLARIAADTSKAGRKAAAYFAEAKKQGIEPADGQAIAATVEAFRERGYSLRTIDATTDDAMPSAYEATADLSGMPVKTVETLHRRHRHEVTSGAFFSLLDFIDKP